MARRNGNIGDALGYRIQHLAALMAKQARISIRQKVGLPQAQWRVLAQLAVGGPQNPNTVAQELDLKRSHVTLAVRSLRRQRLVSQQADETDGRRVLLTLTNAGIDLVGRGYLAHATRRARLMKSLTQQERKVLDITLRKLTAAVQRMLAE